MKKTLTIAIPAHNEENSLPQILNQIRVLKFPRHIKLIKIILISDGSTDKTSSILKTYKLSQIKILRIIDKKRRGKIYRLNQIFQNTTTDFLLILDADINLGKNSVSSLIRKAEQTGGVLTVSHQIPIRPKTFLGQIIYAGYLLWNDIRTYRPEYLDHPQNFYGASSLYHKKFYRTLRIPGQFNDERKFIYYSAKRHGKFVYDLKSIIYYHPVATYRDLYHQSSRSHGIDEKINQYFGKKLPKHAEITILDKIRNVIIHFIKSPIKISLFLLIRYYIDYTKKVDPLVEKGMWSITTSTKKGFQQA